MTMRGGASLALVAAINLALTAAPGMAMPMQDGAVWGSICGDPSRMIRLPTGDDRDKSGGCQSGCHAICSRRKLLDDDGGD